MACEALEVIARMLFIYKLVLKLQVMLADPPRHQDEDSSKRPKMQWGYEFEFSYKVKLKVEWVQNWRREMTKTGKIVFDTWIPQYPTKTKKTWKMGLVFPVKEFWVGEKSEDNEVQKIRISRCFTVIFDNPCKMAWDCLNLILTKMYFDRKVTLFHI